MAAALYAFTRVLNEAMLDRRYDFSDAEIAAGEHCKEQFSRSRAGLVEALEGRMGDTLDDRVTLSIRNVDLGPLRQDGTHRLVALYNINRIGETVGPAKKATGTVTNADCSVKISVFQN